MNEKTIYLDNAATTFPKHESVYSAMDTANRNYAVNSGRGSYSLARKAAEVIEDTRVKLCRLAGGNNINKVIFTPSVTASINQILRGIKWNKGDIVYVTPYEHNAVMRTLYVLSIEFSIDIVHIPIDPVTFEVDLDKMDYLFSQKKPKCVCTTHVSNVTGYILPIKEIMVIAKKYNSITLVDGAQALGLIPFKLEEMEVDFYAFAGHKTLYGPFGIAGFIIKGDIILEKTFTGGTGSDSLNLDMPQDLPNRYEAASPNVVAIAGLNASLEDLLNQDIDIYESEKEKTDLLIKLMKEIEDITLYLPADLNNHISILSCNIGRYNSTDIGMILDRDYNIAVRTGYHCAPLIHEYLLDKKHHGTVRISIGRFTTKDEITKVAAALKEISEEF